MKSELMSPNALAGRKPTFKKVLLTEGFFVDQSDVYPYTLPIVYIPPNQGHFPVYSG